jgi:hypothetical protein
MAEADDREREPDYLWDRTGERDPEVARLEQLLSPLGHDGSPLETPSRAARVTTARAARFRWAAGALTAAAAVALFFVYRSGQEQACGGANGFAFSSDHAVRCEGGRAERGTLAVGGFIETADGAATVTVADIGAVELGARSRLSLRRSARDEHRFALDRGKLHARVLAPPRLFVIETASATAVDLGCEYTLEVDEHGAGRLHVTSGQVELAARKGSLVLVPAGSGARFTREHGVGAPVTDGASPALRDAVARFDRGEARAAEVLAAAKPEDSVTVVNLLSMVSPGERGLVFDRLAQLFPPPSSVEKATVVAGDARAIGQWQRSVVESWMSGDTKSPR